MLDFLVMAQQLSQSTCKKHLKNLINNVSTMLLLFCIAVVSVLISNNVVVAQTIIKTLPGFPGELPFKFETGYVGVGELDEVQLFYYFAESERNPSEDALVLWLTGGPGCSGFSGLVYEIGPLSFSHKSYVGNMPALKLNPYSWTKVANIIFIDSPVGTGFSYATTSDAYEMGDKKTAALLYEFLRKWLKTHPQFVTNQLYIAGDSYSGLIVPIVAKEVSDGDDAGLDPPMNLKGYLLGNPLTGEDYQNYRIPFAHRVSLISDELYESTKRWCHGVYINVDPNNTLCVDNLKLVTRCTEKVNIANVLEPSCILTSPRPKKTKWDRVIPVENVTDLLHSPPQRSGLWCRVYNYVLSYNWANDRSVRKALHVREGTIKEWVRCNESLSYTYDVTSSIEYHRYLVKKGYRALVYSGDHDMVIPYLDTLAWIESDLNLTISDDWKPWFVEGQVAGFTTLYTYKKYQLTFATLKGAGHTGAEYKPREGLAMVYRWFAYYSTL